MAQIKKKIERKLYWLIITITVILSGCIKKPHKQKDAIKTQINQTEQDKQNLVQKEQHTITIWIHGTRSFAHNMFNNFFFRKIGLHNIDKYKEKSNLKKLAKSICNQKTFRFKQDNFYAFGWSGKLSHKKRMTAATMLYEDIIKEIDQYKKIHGVIPKIRLITHSHGGNVALCLAKLMKKKQRTFVISELVLLACPVQEKTEEIIHSPFIEKIYSLYSGLDIIQVLDPQGLYKSKNKKKHFFSQRIFEPLQKLNQTKIKINNRGILHVEFIVPRFGKLLPHILEEVDEWHKADSNAFKQKKLLKIYFKHHKVCFEKKIIKRK